MHWAPQQIILVKVLPARGPVGNLISHSVLFPLSDRPSARSSGYHPFTSKEGGEGESFYDFSS